MPQEPYLDINPLIYRIYFIFMYLIGAAKSFSFCRFFVIDKYTLRKFVLFWKEMNFTYIT